jgi:hypothetical protein
MFDIVGAIKSVSSLVDNVVARIWPDPTEVEKNKIRVLKMEIQRELDILTAQTDINLKEAEHPSLFVSGWRPYIGWVCGFALAYVSLIEPVLRFTAAIGFGYDGDFPHIDTDITLQILLGMLGLGAMRTSEKFKKVARK